ncbi:MAG: ArsA family ATPase [Acidimicrobiales bacterium]|nr:ArsA family ATPase [Acidimicrobiales bacterium]
MIAPLGSIIDDHRVVVCVGTGGVGKTTSAAAVALEAAERGRRAVVVTIDPAKRLADALGLEALGNTPTRIDVGPVDPGFAETGEMWALMLDTKGTFDDLIARYAGDDEQAARIHNNRFYQNISTAMSGTQEYMAMEKLYELYHEERFDLLVVDTPPSRNALDFLEAPGMLTRLLENRLYRALMAPGRGVVRAVGAATQALVRQLSRIVGTDVVDDALAFFRAFEGMEAGFSQRAQEVRALLSSDDACFVLVASPRPDAVENAKFFAQQLLEGGIEVRALVANRLHPYSTAITAAEVAKKQRNTSPERSDCWQALLDYQTLAEREANALAELTEEIGEDVPQARVALLADDVCDLDGLRQVQAQLFPG